MKKILKSKIFIVIAVLVIGGALALTQFLIVRQQVEHVTQPVVKGDVRQTVSATGQVKSATDVALNFKTTGRLDRLNVFVGKKVKKGEELASLRAIDFKIDVDKAYASVQEAQANLQKIQKGATTEEIAITEAEVDKAQASLNSAKSDLQNNEIVYSQALENAEENILTDIKSSLSKAMISIGEIDDILNFEGDANNFATSNIELEQSVVSGYSEAFDKIQLANNAYDLALINSTSQNISLATDKTLSALRVTEETLSDLSALFSFTLKNTVLTQAKLDILKTAINTEDITTNASIETVQSSMQDLLDAQINYNVKVVNAKNDIESAEKSLAKVKADLAFKIAPARSEDISLAQAKVIRAQADLNLAREKLSETKIFAPQAGVITDINYDIGEQTSLATPVIEMAASDNFKIEVDIPESDIAKVEVGDLVNVTLDAFTEEDVLLAVVTTIDPAETEIQDVIYFNVTVLLNEEQDAEALEILNKIKPGMTANIEISTDERTDVVLVPSRAVKEQDGSKFVEILVDGEPVRIDVETGLRGDEGNVEIISGLQPSQQVITAIREK